MLQRGHLPERGGAAAVHSGHLPDVRLGLAAMLSDRHRLLGGGQRVFVWHLPDLRHPRQAVLFDGYCLHSAKQRLCVGHLQRELRHAQPTMLSDRYRLHDAGQRMHFWHLPDVWQSPATVLSDRHCVHGLEPMFVWHLSDVRHYQPAMLPDRHGLPAAELLFVIWHLSGVRQPGPSLLSSRYYWNTHRWVHGWKLPVGNVLRGRGRAMLREQFVHTVWHPVSVRDLQAVRSIWPSLLRRQHVHADLHDVRLWLWNLQTMWLWRQRVLSRQPMRDRLFL